MGTVYEYAISLSGGPTNPLAREMAVWLQRHWAGAGSDLIIAKRRDKNAQGKVVAFEQQQKKLVKFQHPKAADIVNDFEALEQPEGLGELTGAEENPEPAPNPTEENPEAQQPAPNATQIPAENIERQNPVAADDAGAVAAEYSQITKEEFKDFADAKPRAIHEAFGDGRITQTLVVTFGVTAAQMPAREIQRAALLKQSFTK